MSRYILRRLLLVIPTLLIVSFVVFALVRLIPGDAAAILAAGDEVPDQPLRMEQIRHELGLDQPLIVQYATWLGHLAQGDLGISIFSHRPVLSEIGQRLPVTAELALGAILVGVGVGIPWGVLAAVHRNHAGDYVPRVVSVMLLSMPNFWIGTLLIVLPATFFGYLPRIGYVSLTDNVAINFQQLLFPWLAMGSRLIGTTLRMTRSSVLEVLSEDYVRTAWSKGLGGRSVLFGHTLKNGMIPVITSIGGQIAFLLSGSVIIETVFGLPGVGKLTVDAIQARDYPQIEANVLFICFTVVLINLVIDLSYAFFDPRVKYS
jgi:peptide/nickel transport system permease protein